MIGKYLPKVPNANICLKLFCFQTAIFDLSQLGTSKKEEFRVFRGLHERKASLMQLEISFYKVKENIFLIYMLQKFLPEYNTSISNWVGRKIMYIYISMEIYCSHLVVFDSSENDSHPLDRIFLRANRKIILLRSVNYDLIKLLSLTCKTF